MRVAVIGAGVAGLAASRELSKQGIETVVFEAADRVGGRVRTVRENGYVADYGPQQIVPRKMQIERTLLHELPTTGLVKIEKPTHLLQGYRAAAASKMQNSTDRYTYLQGIDEFPRLLAEGLEIRLDARVDEIKNGTAGYRVLDRDFEAVILTAPLPDIAHILAARKDRRANLNIAYRSCLSVCVGFAASPPKVPFYSLLSTDRMTPLIWLGAETEKCPERAPEGHALFVAQYGPEFSEDNFQIEEAKLVSTTVQTVSRIFGSEYSSPDWHFVYRWKISQPERVALFDAINPEGERLILAGDGTVAGRIENAFESGHKAAERIAKLIR
jgi:predicted NAD/FAD-dependent oxidoreductase